MMSKYKAGDIACKFSKPKDSATGAGMKLQSLFQDFYEGKKKPGFQFSQEEGPDHRKKTKDIEKNNRSAPNKSKKRIFSSIDDTESSSIMAPSKRMKESTEEHNIMSKNIKNKKHNASSFNTGKSFVTQKTVANIIEPPAISKLEKGPLGNTRKMSFIKKSKSKNINRGKKDLNDSKLFDDDDFEDVALGKEVQEFLDANSEKTNKVKTHCEFQQDFLKNTDWKEERRIKKTKKAHLKHEKELSEECKSTEQEEKSKNDISMKQMNVHSQKDFPRRKKWSKVKSQCMSNKTESSYDDFEAESQIMVTDWKEQRRIKKAKRALEREGSIESKSSEQNSPVGKMKSNFLRKQQREVENEESDEDSEESEEMSNNEVDDNNETLLKSNNFNFVKDTKFKKNIDGNNQTQNSQTRNTVKSTASDFIRLSSPQRDDPDTMSRTLFVGNLPANTTRKAIKNFFSSFGEIVNIRFKELETDKAKIFGHKDHKVPNMPNAAESVPAFIVFKDRQSAVEALSLSGSIFKGHHITVDFAMPAGSKKHYDEKRSVFIGNLPFSVKDENIWNAFLECGRIEAVRAVRDHGTKIGKGFGYILFSTLQARDNALALKDVKVQGRTLRIKAVDSNKKNQKSNTGSISRDTFKSRALRLKKSDSNSRKSVKKLTKRVKSAHNKKKIAAILQKHMK